MLGPHMTFRPTCWDLRGLGWRPRVTPTSQWHPRSFGWVFSKILMPRFRSSLPTPRYGGADSCALVTEIDFPGRDLGGSLHPEISKLTRLVVLDLDDTNVSGSLDVLANHTELFRLQLRHTRVTGRLEDLSKAKRLWILHLTGTEVAGDLAALANFTKLGFLCLPNTAVSGELKSLAKLERLAVLDLANLKVVGDVAVMAEWSKIQHIDLSGTEVEFDFLQQFQTYSPWKSEWQCPLPALRFLDVSRTSRFRLAKDLLRPFAGCGNLATLKAAGCGLSGPLFPEIRDVWGYMFDEWPLSQALNVLDFARNNVTKVAKIPRSCRTLVLTGNPDVSFGAGVVEKAIKDIVLIDLRNATFGNLSDALLLIGQLAVIPLVTHVLRSNVVAAVTSYAESSNRTHSSQNFRIGSERISCKFVKRISDDQGSPFWHKEVCNQI